MPRELIIVRRSNKDYTAALRINNRAKHIIEGTPLARVDMIQSTGQWIEGFSALDMSESLYYENKQCCNRTNETSV